ncbi:Mitochondrial carrier domain [Pseudocohnilembus persalinus]|uniref:ADP/ATP translocase n=1 Tax=Pseudocohnilembus persalinus TaxID=266149 RepID=A0A0V0R7P3_PSEPJ|nr:Mitochondrial carrier domain [Pseudocohnilembus persalinus]|eukprot:KRX10487.1 Mitochondrial carrier domain [Pseudocohnilembus persalinus]
MNYFKTKSQNQNQNFNQNQFYEAEIEPLLQKKAKLIKVNQNSQKNELISNFSEELKKTNEFIENYHHSIQNLSKQDIKLLCQVNNLIYLNDFQQLSQENQNSQFQSEKQAKKTNSYFYSHQQEIERQNLEKYLENYYKKKQKLNFFVFNIVTSGIAGITSYIFRHPLEVVQIVKSDNQRLKRGRPQTYLGVFITILSQKGVVGLYQYGLCNFTGSFLYYGLLFGIYDTAKIVYFSNNFFEEFLPPKFFLAFTASFIAENLTNIFSTIKNRQFLYGFDSNNKKLTFTQAFINLYQRQGLQRTLFGNISLQRYMAPAIMITIYEKLHPHFSPHSQKLNQFFL